MVKNAISASGVVFNNYKSEFTLSIIGGLDDANG